MTKLVRSLALSLLACGLLASTSFAATLVSGGVTPSITPPGSVVFIHSAVTNGTISNQAVTVSLTVTNPGTCVTGNLPTHAGAFAFSLRPNETRFGTLSMDIPPSTCSGTYTVTMTVKNSAGTVLATHTTTFTVAIPTT